MHLIRACMKHERILCLPERNYVCELQTQVHKLKNMGLRYSSEQYVEFGIRMKHGCERAVHVKIQKKTWNWSSGKTHLRYRRKLWKVFLHVDGNKGKNALLRVSYWLCVGAKGILKTVGLESPLFVYFLGWQKMDTRAVAETPKLGLWHPPTKSER